MPLFRRAFSGPFRLTYGTVIPNHRGGGSTNALIQGWRTSSPPDIPYRYLVEIVSSAEKTYPLIVALSDLLDSDCAAVLEVHKSDAVITYETTGFSREKILRALEPYAFRLVNDGFTGFGLASRNFEVFLTDHKDIRVFAQELTQMKRVLKPFGIEERPNLRFLAPGPPGPHYHVSLVAYFEEEKVSKLGESLPVQEREKHAQAPGTYRAFHQAIIGQLEMKEQSRTAPT